MAEFTPLMNTTKVTELLAKYNQNTGGQMGLGLLVTICFIVFIALLRYGFPQAFAAAMFIGTLFAIGFVVLGILSQYALLIMFILVGLSVFLLYLGGR